jgi:hypothetical protein
MSTVMRVVTDGDDGLQNFVQRNIPTPAETQLDWFHIGVRLENLRKAVNMPMTYDESLGPQIRGKLAFRSCETRYGKAVPGELGSSLPDCDATSIVGKSRTRTTPRRKQNGPARPSMNFENMCAATAGVCLTSQSNEPLATEFLPRMSSQS